MPLLGFDSIWMAITKGVVKLMTGLGLVLATKAWIVGPLFDAILAQVGLSSSDAYEWIALSQLDTALEIIGSAYTLRAANRARRAFFGVSEAAT